MPGEGIQTELTASLQAGAFSREYRFPVMLYPPLRTKQQEKEAGFKQLLKQMDEAQRTEGQLVLPKMYEGKNLSYRVRGDREYLLFPVLGIAAAILLPLYEKQKESEEKKKKKRELMEDYPEIVSKLTVFSGRGFRSAGHGNGLCWNTRRHAGREHRRSGRHTGKWQRHITGCSAVSRNCRHMRNLVRAAV